MAGQTVKGQLLTKVKMRALETVQRNRKLLVRSKGTERRKKAISVSEWVFECEGNEGVALGFISLES